MSVSLTVHEGRPALEIEDSKGELWAYWFEVLPAGPGVFRVRLTVVGDPSRSYVVILRPGGHWCACKDYQCRPEKRLQGCKHCKGAAKLRSLLGALQGVSPCPTQTN